MAYEYAELLQQVQAAAALDRATAEQVTFDPDKARIDAALRQMVAQPYGPWLLSLMALGLMCFGAYSFAESRYRRL